VITDKQEKITEYVTKTYSSAKVITQDNMMRLDFDNDGSISVDDLKKSMVGLYEFLKNFDVIEATTSVKSKLYSDAIAYMQNELDEDSKQKSIKIDQAPIAPEAEVEEDVNGKNDGKKQKKNK
jgi:hypothetical protein